jgi:lipid II isoglutaminyl synthase (glutamine-hydrolysing)
MKNPALLAAVNAGKVSALAARVLGRGGGTALPGLVAQTVFPGVMRAITAQLPNGSLMVSGTNGKTTTSRMIGGILEAAGLAPLHNRSGSNLERGLISTLVGAATPTASLPRSYKAGLFEVDEAAMPGVLPAVNPRVLLLNNLFRDQLDRYGEIDAIYSKWRAVLPRLSTGARLVLNADDPAIAALGQVKGLRAAPFTFGIDDSRYTLEALPHAADSISCPRCNSRLEYSLILLSHLGHWRCSNCGLERPRPDVAATRVRLNGTESSTVQLRTPQGEAEIVIRVPGLYNVYNGLAATAAALAFGVSMEHIKQGLESFTAAFGRIERVAVPGPGDKHLLMALVKNPVGFNEVLRMLFPLQGMEGERQAESPRNLLIIINDLTADGRDVSWLWDVDFEVLVTSPQPPGSVYVSGIRAADMAVRLKYAGLEPENIHLDNSLDGALDSAMAALPKGETLYVLPTYTAMLAFRKLLHSRGWVQSQFWED